MKYVMLLISLIAVENSTFAVEFNAKQLKVINDIIWAADLSEVPRELLLAICWKESTFRTKGVTHMDGDSLSHGICQVKLETAQWMDEMYKHKYKATEKRLASPRVNAFYASKFLKYQLSRYEGNWKLAMDSYNKGSATGTHTEYVKSVNSHITMFKTVLTRK